MRADKKRARSKNKLAELFGLEAPVELNGPTAARLKEDRSREAEAVIAYVHDPAKFRDVTCRHCGQPFMVNRANVALCSDYCRAKELEAVGIRWRWDRSPEERWYYVYDGDKRNTEPLVVGPEATAMLSNFEVSTDSPVSTDSSLSEKSDDSFLYGDFEV